MAQDILDFKVNIDTANAATLLDNLGDKYDSIKDKMEKDKITPKIDLDGIKSQVSEIEKLIGNIGKTSGSKKNKIDLSGMFGMDQSSFNKMADEWIKKYNASQKKIQSASKKSQLAAAQKATKYPFADETLAKYTKNLNAYSRQKGNISGADLTTLNNAESSLERIKTLQLEIADGIKSGKSDNSILANYKALGEELQRLDSLMGILGATMEKSLDSSAIDSALNKVQQYRDGLKEVTEEQNKLLNSIEDKYNQSGLTKSEKNSVDREFQEVKNTIAQQNKLAEIQREALSGKYSLTSAKADTFLSKYNGQSSEVLNRARAELAEYKKISAEVTALSKKKQDGEIIDTSKLEKSKEKLVQCGERMKNVLEEVRVAESKTLDPKVASTSANSVQKYINDNTKAWKKYKTELESVRDMYKNATTVGEKSAADVEFKRLKSAISADGLSGKGLFGSLQKSFSQLSKFSGVWAMAQGAVVDIPQKIISAVTEVNSAQIELTKVSNASGSQLSQYWNQAADSAKKYGATISDVISSTADWSKQGYDLNEAKTLSDVTTLYQKVGDNMTQETASQSLVSTLQGFNMQADQAESIVDKFNEVANNYAIGSDGIGEALQRSAASFNAAHTDISKSIALITGTNTTLQDPARVGNMWKTVSARLRGKILCLRTRKVCTLCCTLKIA